MGRGKKRQHLALGRIRREPALHSHVRMSVLVLTIHGGGGCWCVWQSRRAPLTRSAFATLLRVLLATGSRLMAVQCVTCVGAADLP